MKRSDRKREFLHIFVLGLSLAFCGPASADRPTPGASPTPTPPKFDIPIPPGRGAQGVNLPYFDEHGRLQMYYCIKKATRVDQDHMTMKMADIQTYDEKENPETNIFLKRSSLDLNTRVVTSDVPVAIQRADLRLTGDTMTFDTVKHKGRMVGHIVMVLYNNHPAESPAPAASPSPSTAPSTAPASPAPTTAP